MNAFGEKSMLILAALTLGLIIAWLIASDPNVSAPPPAHQTGAGLDTSRAAVRG